MQQFILALKGRRGHLKCWARRRREEEGLNILLPFYLLLGEIDLRGPFLSSFSNNETHDDT